MAQTTTNYGLLKPEATDSYNHLIYDNPNMDTIDAAMKANSDAAITTATCIKSGTTHTITRSNTSAAVMRFTATGDWNTGDTMIIDGVTVSPFLPTGEALRTGAYLINTEVIIALSGTRATVLSNQSEAGTTYFDDSNVSFTANNVEDAIEQLDYDVNNLIHYVDHTFANVTNGDNTRYYTYLTGDVFTDLGIPASKHIISIHALNWSSVNKTPISLQLDGTALAWMYPVGSTFATASVTVRIAYI